MNNFDKNIKKKLYNSQMPVSDGLWSSIESQIPVKKEQPKYWLLFLLCACAVSFGIFTLDKEGVGGTISAEVEAEQVEEQVNANIYYKASSEQGSTLLPVKDSKEGNTAKGTNVAENNASLGSGQTMPSTQKLQFTRPSRSLVTQQNKTLRTTRSSKNIALSDLVSNRQNLKSTNSNTTFDSAKKLKFVNNPFKTFNSKSGNKSAFKLIEKSRIYKCAEPLNSLASLDENFYKQGIASSEKIDLSYGLLIDKYSVAACPSFEPYSSGLYVFADVTSSYNFQSLDAINPEYKGLEELRNSKERGTVSISATLGLGKQWANGFLLETGLNYDKISIDSRQYAEDVPPRLMITIDSMLTPAGWEITRDSSYIDYSDEGMVTNTFSQFNIPVVFGYELFLNDRFSLVTKAGALINIASRNKGQISNSNGDLVSYDSDNISTSLFKTNLGMSFTGSLQLQGELTPLLAAYTGINLNYYPDNFSLSTYPIKQTYTKIGLSAGLKYRL